MLTWIEIVIIVLFTITVSVVVGLSISHIIDKKLSNVAINIPQPNIIVKITPDQIISTQQVNGD